MKVKEEKIAVQKLLFISLGQAFNYKFNISILFPSFTGFRPLDRGRVVSRRTYEFLKHGIHFFQQSEPLKPSSPYLILSVCVVFSMVSNKKKAILRITKHYQLPRNLTSLFLFENSFFGRGIPKLSRFSPKCHFSFHSCDRLPPPITNHISRIPLYFSQETERPRTLAQSHHLDCPFVFQLSIPFDSVSVQGLENIINILRYSPFSLIKLYQMQFQLGQAKKIRFFSFTNAKLLTCSLRIELGLLSIVIILMEFIQTILTGNSANGLDEFKQAPELCLFESASYLTIIKIRN
ncbi:hypothetical protein EGR_04931 [Echinococcus granulosus]|uniref:Uncharacterized protein n=1 Tax=Echinococcus granulosus TaxID=6210 RepID=W6UGU6_ECHGR|nr:hypothetical protein EGR_04931 [Echinococcus granulosus]EUB60221.1 hypothetical protein EGR_04931 [Echinococcus granulosus]